MLSVHNVLSIAWLMGGISASPEMVLFLQYLRVIAHLRSVLPEVDILTAGMQTHGFHRGLVIYRK